MSTNHDKQESLALETKIKQTCKRLLRGVGAIRENPAKAVPIVPFYALLTVFYAARHKLLGYAPGDLLAPLNDLLAVLVTGVPAVAAPPALLWAVGGPKEAGKVQDNLLRAGLVNSAGEAPTLISTERDPNNPNVKIYTFESCGIALTTWMDSADKIQTCLNMTIADIRYGIDHQHIQLSAASPMTMLPTDLRYHRGLLPQEHTVLLLGLSAMGPFMLDLRYTPHLMIGGSTNSGKSVTLKFLLFQCVAHGMEVTIADFKGGVDFCAPWWRKSVRLVYDLEGLVQLLDTFMEALDERKKLFREEGCSNIEQYNTKIERAQPVQLLPRMVFATDEAAFVLDKSGHTKEEKELIDKIAAKLNVLTAQGRAFGLHVFLSTQRPDSQVIPSFVRSNIDTRICGRADKILSEIVLGSTIANEVIPKTAQGRFVMNDGCGNSATVFQSYYLPDYILEGEGH